MRPGIVQARLAEREKTPPVFTFDAACHEYRLDGVRIPGITEIISMLDRGWYTDEAAERGRVIHEFCVHSDNGTWKEDMTDDAEIKAKIRGWERFKHDAGFEPTFIELPMYNALQRYGGTPDRIGFLKKHRRIANHEAVVEIKSGGMNKLIRLQTAAQEQMVRTTYGYKSLPRFGVQLLPDNYKLVRHEDRSDWAAFLGLLQAKKWEMAN